MKKALRFSLLCCLLLAVILTASACLGTQTPEETTPQTTTQNITTPEVTTPEATTPEATTPAETTPEETTTPAPVDPDQPEGSVLVDSIGGKNAKEAMEAFVDSFSNAESYDWVATMESVEDGVVTSQYMSIKLYNGEVAAIMQTDFVAYEVYFVDGVLYINNGGQKMKLSTDHPEEMLGEGFFEGLTDMVPDFSEEKELTLEDTKIYLLDGIYYITLYDVDEDTGEEKKLCYQFNEAGELVKTEGTSANGEYMSLTINSYNKPVEITPPADADEYSTIGNAVAPEGAVAVDTVNGMNATQLFEKFVEEYSASTAYDIKISMKQTTDDETLTMSIVAMITQDAVYYGMEMDESIVKMWIVDGVGYIFSDGKKIKQEGINIDDVFGEGYFDSLINSLVAEIPDEYYNQLAEAQLYYYEGLYFYTIVMFQPTAGITTEIVFFDEDGKVVRVIDQAEGISVDQTINSYGNKPVIITPPADADEYIDAGATPDTPALPETEDEIYALYESICTTMQESESYTVDVWITDLYFSYKIAGEDKSLSFMDGESWIEQCIIDQIGYIRIDYGENIETSLNKEFLESFTSVEALLSINTLAKNDLQNLRCSYDEDWGEIVIEFEYAGEDNTLTQYRYAIQEDGSYIDITVTELVDGIEGDSYSFFFVEDPTLEIKLPIGK